MPNLEEIKADLSRYRASGLALLFGLILVYVAIISRSLVYIVGDRQLVWNLLLVAVLVAATSSRSVLRLTGTNVATSAADTLVFLAIIAFGPRAGVLLAGIDTLLASRRLGLRRSLQAFNVANVSISFYVAGAAYTLASHLLEQHPLSSGIGQWLISFGVPVITLALVHYSVNALVFSAMARIAFGMGLRAALLSRLPWEPMTFLASATVAGVVHYVALNAGLVVAAITLVLMLPVPILIYYTFKTYRDKLQEQDRHFKELTEINDSILEMLAMAIDAKDQTTHDHIQRVRLFARRMGEIVGLTADEIEAVKAGALLHDIGKIGVPAYILNKPGKLTEHEFEQMKLHTIIGADMLSNVNFRYPVVPIVRHHHERWDGKGYPDGLKGEDIPITARILTLVDNYDALRSDRPYHKAMTQEQTLDYIQQNAGKFFDPRLVEIFLSKIEELEAEASKFKSEDVKRPVMPESLAMRQAAPANGFDTGPVAKPDRAAAALHSIAEVNQRVTALYDLARNLAGAFSLEDTTAVLANRMAKLIPFTTLTISLFDGTRSEFTIVHASGRDADKFWHRSLPVSAGITGWVIQNQRPMLNTNPLLDLSFLERDAAEQYKALMVFPLVKGKEALGAIAVYSTELDSYSSEYIQLMESISQPVSDSIYNALAFEQAQHAALTDPLTGLANMRAFSSQFDRERARALRTNSPMSLLVASIERLPSELSEPFVAPPSGMFVVPPSGGQLSRESNQRQSGQLPARPRLRIEASGSQQNGSPGQSAGPQEANSSSKSNEEFVAMLGNLLKERLRDIDLIARSGSAAFVVLLAESGQSEALEVMARMHEAIAEIYRGTGMMVSLGSATFPENGDTLEDLMKSAHSRTLSVRESLHESDLLSL